MNESHNRAARKALLKAKRENDSMVYIDGPQVYACSNCRTHLTSHDDIISKSFHGRHGRAYLFDECVNVTTGPKENRRLMTGLHVVSDIHCKRCKRVVGWTYSKAYEHSQKYKEGKYVIEKIHLHLEENSYYNVEHPAGERNDRWRKRSMSWGNNGGHPDDEYNHRLEDDASMVYEYSPRSPSMGSSGYHCYRNCSMSTNSSNSEISGTPSPFTNRSVVSRHSSMKKQDAPRLPFPDMGSNSNMNL